MAYRLNWMLHMERKLLNYDIIKRSSQTHHYKDTSYTKRDLGEVTFSHQNVITYHQNMHT